MSSLFERVREQAMHLTAQERGFLAHELLTSLDQDEARAEQAWEDEVARRVEGIRSGAEEGHPAEEVLLEIRKHLSAR